MPEELEKKIISHIQGDIPLHKKPFKILAEKVGISEQEFLDTIKRLKKRNIIRRFGATLRHQEAGFSSNAMIAWKVPEHRVDEVGTKMAEFREVTHCYQRVPHRDWPYNLYTMVHGNSRQQCYDIAEDMSSLIEIDDYILLFSEKEFKKTSMEYF